MSMTREESIAYFEVRGNYNPHDGTNREAEKMALTALRGPTREMVERMQGEWIHDGPEFEGGTDWYHCSKCGANETGVYVKYNFCPYCGNPKTKQAVEIIYQQLLEA